MNVETLERAVEDAERRAAALRKLIEAKRELGDEEVARLLGVPNDGNGHANGAQSRRRGVFAGETTAGDQASGIAAEATVRRGREAIREIVRQRPGIWTLRELREAQKRDGSFTSAKATEVAVTRLMALGECRRVGKGRYEFFSTEEAGA
jgi:hypothetical protein